MIHTCTHVFHNKWQHTCKYVINIFTVSKLLFHSSDKNNPLFSFDLQFIYGEREKEREKKEREKERERKKEKEKRDNNHNKRKKGILKKKFNSKVKHQ